MWMLVIILLNTVPGISTVTLLETYPTSQECHSKRARIGLMMRWRRHIPMSMTSRLPVVQSRGSRLRGNFLSSSEG
jgi:hypothetical protein